MAFWVECYFGRSVLFLFHSYFNCLSGCFQVWLDLSFSGLILGAFSFPHSL